MKTETMKNLQMMFLITLTTLISFMPIAFATQITTFAEFPLLPFYKSPYTAILGVNTTYVANVTLPTDLSSLVVYSAIVKITGVVVTATTNTKFNVSITNQQCNTGFNTNYNTTTAQQTYVFDCRNIITGNGIYSINISSSVALIGGSAIIDVTYSADMGLQTQITDAQTQNKNNFTAINTTIQNNFTTAITGLDGNLNNNFTNINSGISNINRTMLNNLTVQILNINNTLSNNFTNAEFNTSNLVVSMGNNLTIINSTLNTEIVNANTTLNNQFFNTTNQIETNLTSGITAINTTLNNQFFNITNQINSNSTTQLNVILSQLYNQTTYILANIGTNVWSYSTRTLTSFGTLISDIWNYGNIPTLNVTIVNGTQQAELYNNSINTPTITETTITIQTTELNITNTTLNITNDTVQNTILNITNQTVNVTTIDNVTVNVLNSTETSDIVNQIAVAVYGLFLGTGNAK